MTPFMDRRVFIGTLSGGLLAAPLAAGAQPAREVYRIGWLGNAPPTSPSLQRQSEAFLQGLRDHGFVEGQNVIIERRYSEGREDRHTAFVAELVQMKVDLIVTTTSAAAHPAKQATSTIPIFDTGRICPCEGGWGSIPRLTMPLSVLGRADQLIE